MPRRRIQPTALAWLVRHTLRYAEAAGLEAATLLDEVGLPQPGSGDQREWRLPLRDQTRLLNHAAEALGDPQLGFHLALDIDLREWGPIYYVLASAATLKEAVASEARTASPFEEGFRAVSRCGVGFGLTFQFTGVESRLDRHLAEFTVTAHLRLFRHLTRTEIVPSRVAFIHQGDRDVAEIRRFFRTAPVFGATEHELMFSRDVANLGVATSDPFLGKLIVELRGGLPGGAPKEPFRAKVETALTATLGNGPIRMDDLAAKVGLSRRTLARRLAEEGETFGTILDRVRHELALNYLRKTQLPISGIGWLLGYARPSAFVRAVRRWTGATPRAIRRAGTTAAA